MDYIQPQQIDNKQQQPSYVSQIMQGKLNDLKAILQKDISQISFIISDSMKVLDDQSKSMEYRENSLKILEGLLLEYKHPIPIMLNDPEYAHIFYSSYNDGLQYQIFDVLHASIQMFEFNKERTLIKYLASMYKELLSLTEFSHDSQQKEPDYIKAYSKIKVLRDLLEDYDVLKSDQKEKLKNDSFQLQNEVFIAENLSPIAVQHLIDTLSSLIQGIKQAESFKPMQPEQKLKPNFEENKNRNAPKPRFRTYFYQSETLQEDENQLNEYKDYEVPIKDPKLKKVIIKTICSFLNRRGGRIYIGVNDNRQVTGVKLNSEIRDRMKQFINNSLQEFYPSVRNDDFVSVHFIPLRDFLTDKVIPSLGVVKILVKQGNPSILYSVSNNQLECYIRNDGQSVYLKADETYNRIVERSRNPEQREDSQNFIDPQPEQFVDSQFFQQIPDKKIPVSPIKPMHTQHAVKIANLPFILTPKEFKELIGRENDLTIVSDKLVMNEGKTKSKGYGYVNFQSSDQARNFRNKMKNKIVGGRTIDVSLKLAHE